MDLDVVTRIIVEAAAREVLPRFRKLGAEDIATKSGPNDLVTAADLACEALLTEQLLDLHPGSTVVGEEAVSNNPQLLTALSRPGDVWVIDPVDGTLNFANGTENFAVIVALVRDGALEAGWIHVPLQEKTVVAQRGGGTYCQGQRLEVAEGAGIEQMHAVLYAGAKRFPALHARIQALRPRLGPRSFARSAGMEYVGLVEGRIHYALFTRQLPWDHAAGSLIHAEAGGHGAYLDRSLYRPVDEAKPLLLAPDPATWETLRNLFTEVGD